jgi:hypothetical protein
MRLTLKIKHSLHSNVDPRAQLNHQNNDVETNFIKRSRGIEREKLWEEVNVIKFLLCRAQMFNFHGPQQTLDSFSSLHHHKSRSLISPSICTRVRDCDRIFLVSACHRKSELRIGV